MSNYNDNRFLEETTAHIDDGQKGSLRKINKVLSNNDTTLASLNTKVSTETTLASVLSRLQAIKTGGNAEPITELDNGPASTSTVTNLKGAAVGAAQVLAAAPGSGLKAQIRDMFVSVTDDVRVSIYSGSNTLLVANLKAGNGTVQLCPRQGFTGDTNTAIEIIATTSIGTQDTTVNSVAV